MRTTFRLTTAILAVTLAASRAAGVPTILEPIHDPAPARVENRTAPLARALGPAGVQSLGNVQVNDPSGVAAGTNDYNPAMAAIGNHVLVVWTVRGTAVTQRMRAAISTDGGVTFTDVGWLPGLSGDWRWGTDPCVESDPSTNTFFVAAQAASPATSQAGIAFVTAQIGSGIQWGTPSLVRVGVFGGAYYGNSFDMHFDRTLASLDMVFHDSFSSPQALTHQVSWDRGATWSSPTTLVSHTVGYLGLGPRVASTYFGPIVQSMDVANWEQATLTSRRSVGGFQPPVTMSSFRIDGASLPGTAADNPGGYSIAVDRTFNRFQDRIYSAWVASCGFPTWPVPSGTTVAESEANDTPAQANPIGGAGWVDGAFQPTTEKDCFVLWLSQSQRLVVRATNLVSAGQTFIDPTLLVEVVDPDGIHGLGQTSLPQPEMAYATMLFTAPHDGAYTLRVGGANVTSYQFSLAFSSLANPGMDRKDLWFTTSNSGGAWAIPSLMPFEQTPGFDVSNAKVIVGNDGCPYLFWQDWSEDPFGRVMSVRATRSTDSGYSWATPRILSTVSTDWQSVGLVNSTYKIGWRLAAATTPPYIGELEPNRPSSRAKPAASQSAQVGENPEDRLYVAWTDGRLGQSDIFSASFPTGFTVAYRTIDTTATPGEYLGLRMALVNWNGLFSQWIDTVVPTCQRNWPSSYGSMLMDPGQSISTSPYVIAVPETAAAGTVFFQGSIDVGPQSFGLNTFIHVQSTVGVEGGPTSLDFRAPAPNPAITHTNFRFALPAAAEVALEIFDVRGAHVRTLLAGRREKGSQAQGWDLRDDAGHRVSTGLYLSRLTVGNWIQTRRVAVVQ